MQQVAVWAKSGVHLGMPSARESCARVAGSSPEREIQTLTATCVTGYLQASRRER